MQRFKIIPKISASIILLSILFCSNGFAQNTIAPDILQPNVNRIIWVNWHSGDKSFETEGTLREVIPDYNCISLTVRVKFPNEEIRFEGERILYINLSAIDAFEIRMPK
ncbi:MAG: hypothetical protein V3S06_02365 [candidate division Zixibacteria bacterium]